MVLDFIHAVALLWFLHCLADFGLQSEAMARGKNKNLELKNKERLVKEGIIKEEAFKKCWGWWLSGHAGIHALLIMLVFPTFWYLGLIEFIAHYTLDYIKTNGKTNPHQDQMFHIILRIIYALVVVL